jgi:hypothetical protein
MHFERGSKRYCSESTSDFLYCATSGWMRASVERTRAQRLGSKDLGMER